MIEGSPKSTSYNSFVTESDIQLGISKEELIDIKGNGYETEGNTLKYYLTEESEEGRKFLEKYNMPYYYAYYTFQDDKLIKIEFGFLYP